jgi:hypothetical protein
LGVAAGWSPPGPTVAEKASAKWEASAGPYPGLIGETLEVESGRADTPPLGGGRAGTPRTPPGPTGARGPPFLKDWRPNQGLLDVDSGSADPSFGPPPRPSGVQRPGRAEKVLSEITGEGAVPASLPFRRPISGSPADIIMHYNPGLVTSLLEAPGDLTSSRRRY